MENLNTRATYDVAISFAGEQRDIARSINDILKDHRIKTFFDEDHIVDLWGKNLAEHLPTIYADSARFVLMLLSDEYLTKIWTKVERRASISRMIRQNEEYLLIYKIGNFEVPTNAGISADVSYLSDAEYASKDVADMILSKLGIEFSNEKIKKIVMEYVDRNMMDELNLGDDSRWNGGFIPFVTLKDGLHAEHGAIGKRLGHFLVEYLDKMVSDGAFERYGGEVIGYRINTPNPTLEDKR